MEADYVQDLTGILTSVRQAQVASTTGPDSFNNMLILGGRGSGKSTLLNAFARSLDPDQHVVLPRVDPELMFPGDSLMTLALTGLESALPPSTLDQNLDEDPRTIRKLLHDLRRDYVVVSANLPSSLINRGVGPAEFARDASALTPIGMRLTSAWSSLLDRIAEASNRPDLAFVLLIDDVDLHPNMLPLLLKQLEIMGTSRRFAAVLAADEAALLTSMIFGDEEEARYWQRALAHDLASRQDLADLAQEKDVEVFPSAV